VRRKGSHRPSDDYIIFTEALENWLFREQNVVWQNGHVGPARQSKYYVMLLSVVAEEPRNSPTLFLKLRPPPPFDIYFRVCFRIPAIIMDNIPATKCKRRI